VTTLLANPTFIILIPDLLMTAAMLTDNTNFSPMILEILFARSFIGKRFENSISFILKKF
jgi:hypothetical protein